MFETQFFRLYIFPFLLFCSSSFTFTSKIKSVANRYFFFTAMHTCRLGTDASNRGLAGRVATAIMRTEQKLHKERIRVSNDGLTRTRILDQSLKVLEINCTLKTAPAIGVTSRFNTTNHLSRPARGGASELNRATGTAAACGGTSSGGGGQGRRKGFAMGSSFGGLACWAWVLPWVLLVLGGVEGVDGEPIPDCTYAVYVNPGCTDVSCYNNRTCGIRKAVDDYIAGSTGSYGPIEDWDTSLVTDMSWLFFQKSTFNADISKWQVGKVTNMDRSTCTLSPPSPRSGLFLAASVSLLLSVAALILFLNNALSSSFFSNPFLSLNFSLLLWCSVLPSRCLRW